MPLAGRGSAIPDVPAQPEPTRHSLLARYPLVCFFMMAYAFTWIVISPWTLGATGAGLLPLEVPAVATGLLLAAGIFAGSTLAAIVMTAVSGIALFVLVAVAFSVVLSWVFNNTHAGLLIVVLIAVIRGRLSYDRMQDTLRSAQ